MIYIPDTWILTTLDTVGIVITGNTPSTKEQSNFNGRYPFVKPADLDGTQPIVYTSQTLSEKGILKSRKLRAGSVLVSCIGNLGKVGIAGLELATNQQINSIEFNNELVDDKYGYYFCRTLKQWMEQESSATTITILNKNRFSKAPFVLAPLNEQKRIADKLDVLLGRVDSCRERLERVPLLLKRFRQSVLSAAISGTLTENWREKNLISNAWNIERLASIADSRLGKMLDHNKNQGLPTKYLRNINVRWFNFDLKDVQEIRINERESKELVLRTGDVLVCEGGEPGRCAIWKESEKNFVFQKALHRVRVGDKLLPEWLTYCLKNAADSGSLETYFTGTTIKHLTGVSLAKFQVPLPTLDEQHEIIRRVSKLMLLADTLESHYLHVFKYFSLLTPALLAKAFRGELLPQDPDDESAIELLSRIRKNNSETQVKNEQQRKKVKTLV